MKEAKLSDILTAWESNELRCNSMFFDVKEDKLLKYLEVFQIQNIGLLFIKSGCLKNPKNIISDTWLEIENRVSKFSELSVFINR